MNDYRAYVECQYNSIYHHGIKGQHWGVRRFQNEDGSLTPAGQKRYRVEYNKWTGETKVVDRTGKKMDSGDRRAFESLMEERAKTDDEFNRKYIQYRQAKNAANNYAIGWGAGGAMGAALYNGMTSKSRAEGKSVVDDILTEFANSYLDDVEKQLKK